MNFPSSKSILESPTKSQISLPHLPAIPTGGQGWGGCPYVAQIPSEIEELNLLFYFEQAWNSLSGGLLIPPPGAQLLLPHTPLHPPTEASLLTSTSSTRKQMTSSSYPQATLNPLSPPPNIPLYFSLPLTLQLFFPTFSI